MNYSALYQDSLNNKEGFWRDQAGQLPWIDFPSIILQQTADDLYQWFPDGQLNMSHACLDYHIQQGRGEQLALIYDSPVTQTIRRYSYVQLLHEVSRFAGVLTDLGVQKGDTVVLYMPMIPEAVIAMLACARIGAIHSVVFGGFAPHELALRIEDAQPKVLISASFGIEGTKVIPYKPLVDKALLESNYQPAYKIFVQRMPNYDSLNHQDELDYSTLMERAHPVSYTAVASTHPLYILYTSGTTGKPKGIVRDTGGYATALKFSMKAIYDIDQGDVFWAASDVGWVVGHSYIVYGPLLQGCTTILFEGKPIGTPDAGVFWRVIEDHKVKTLFTAPTAIRAIKKEDSPGDFLKKYNLSHFKSLFLAGERCDPPTFHWVGDLLNKPVIDHWWQTESGWPMLGIPMGIEPMPSKAGSAGIPICGFDIQIIDETSAVQPAGTEGIVVAKLPLPPGCLHTLWKNTPRFKKEYTDPYPGYYLTGDGGYKDEAGYCFIMGRIDDVINVSGHRLSTGEMEEIVAGHSAIAECAVVGIADELRGQRPIAFVVAKNGIATEAETLEKEIIELVRDQIGAIAFLKNVYPVQRLPKTRSGKILRKTIRCIADNVPFTVPSTIDDPVILDEIRAVLGK